MSGPVDLPLTPADVDLIVAALDGSQFATLEVATPRFTLKIARGDGGGWTQDWRHAAALAPVATVTMAAAGDPVPPALPEGVIAVRAPLPGSFFRSPQPGAAPFVTVGAVVAADTVIGIIETMKVMNSVPAGVAGTITAILATDGVMVDPTFVLMHVRP